MYRLLLLTASLLCVTACAGRGDYRAIYLAEQGDYDGALSAASSSISKMDGLLFGSGVSDCSAFASEVLLHVAKSDFASASAMCTDYDDRCANVPGSGLCFNYVKSELTDASGDSALAESLSSEAQEALHFRWLMIRDDYEGNALKRPIY